MNSQSPQEDRAVKVNRRRYWRTVRFFLWLFARALWWERFVKSIFGAGFVARGRQARLAGWSQEFRDLAVDMTGLMIKVGQFIGSRADLLPPAITGPLRDLQDEVPAEQWSDMRAAIERELGPLDAAFAWVDETTRGAASLGQVHRAQLHSGDRVVIKVQRPNIDQIVATDLAAMDVVASLAMNWRFIAQRMDLPQLMDEFKRVTWQELDYIQEAENAALFDHNFAGEAGVYVPATYPELTTRRVLVMEDVTAIKIGDFAAIEAAGISRVEVAQRLLDTYLQQVFEDRFFHADPHPGNLFVYPLPPDAAGDIPEGEGAPFYLIFVDFGMTGHLTEQIVEGIRETLVSIFTQDVRRMVKSFERLGILLPGADMDRIEEAMRTIFDRIWGLDMSKLVGVAYSDMYQIARDFADLLYTLPFQVPQDFVFLSRALNILAGICTALDPDFNPWASVAPYAQRFILEEQSLGLGKTLVQEAREFATLAMRLPRRADAVLHRADRGDLRVQMKPTSDFQRQIDRLENTLNQMVLAIVFASVVLASTLLYVGDQQSCGSVGFIAAAALLLLLLWRGRPRLG